MAAPATPPIIIIKKKGHGGGHHGGAWKVAYADFVTAMMALFIVLWLLSSSQEVQQAVAGYFRDPRGSGKRMGSAYGGTGESVTIDRKNLSHLQSKLQEAMKESPKFAKIKDLVKMTVTGEGLRIELLENEKGTFFESGQSKPTATAAELLDALAKELGPMPNRVLIEGHTDSKPFGDTADYTNWELSADRANSARKLMQANGLRDNQVVEIRGFADQQLRVPEKPEDPSNRRISIIVRYTEPQPEPGSKTGKEGAAAGKEGAGKEGAAAVKEGAANEGESKAKPSSPSAAPEAKEHK